MAFFSRLNQRLERWQARQKQTRFYKATERGVYGWARAMGGLSGGWDPPGRRGTDEKSSDARSRPARR
jgi:hypothetical protein